MVIRVSVKGGIRYHDSGEPHCPERTVVGKVYAGNKTKGGQGFYRDRGACPQGIFNRGANLILNTE